MSKILFCHSKIKFISSRHHVISTIYVPCYYASFKYKSELFATKRGPLAESISLAKLEANRTPGPSSSKDG